LQPTRGSRCSRPVQPRAVVAQSQRGCACGHRLGGSGQSPDAIGDEVTELRLSVPDGGRRLLPLSIAVWLIQRRVRQVAEAAERKVEEVFEAETATALHEDVMVDLVTQAFGRRRPGFGCRGGMLPVESAQNPPESVNGRDSLRLAASANVQVDDEFHRSCKSANHPKGDS
jgi:hypothetical protein